MRFKSATIPHFAKLRSAVLIHFQDISPYDTHSQFPCANKSQYLTFSRLQNLIQWQCDTVNLTPPCKYFITHAKILHAKYFMQRMQNKAHQKLNKADENCEMKQQFFYGQLLLFFVTEKQQKNKLLWWRHNKL